MNIAFWLLVILALAGIWFLCNPVFKVIGQFWVDLFSNTKKNLSADKVDMERKEDSEFEQR